MAEVATVTYLSQSCDSGLPPLKMHPVCTLSASHPPSLPVPPIFNLPALILITRNDGEEPALKKLKRKMESSERGRNMGGDGGKSKEWKEGGGFVALDGMINNLSF